MASIDKRPNGQWRARWREYPSGPQRAKHFPRKVDADRFLVGVRHRLASGTYVASEMEWESWTMAYADRQPWRDSSRARIMQVLDASTRAWGRRPLESIRRGDVEAFLVGLELSPTSTR